MSSDFIISSKNFCKNKNYIDCIEIGKTSASVIFKAVANDNKKNVCFTIIKKSEYDKNSKCWNIIKLVNKFIFLS
jgi:hypothetical protein